MFTRAIIIVRLAVAFLTRIPGAHPASATPDDFGCAHAVFPAIGLLIGAVIAGVQLAAITAGVPPIAAAALALVAGMLLTGALHEDGLADTADGFGGGRDREAKLTIMRDSRVGTYGALALVLAIIIKVGALSSQAGTTLVVLLALSHAFSRSAASIVGQLLPAARTDGLSARAGRPPAAAIAISVGISLVAGLMTLPPMRLAAAVVATAFVIAGIFWVAKRQIGGQTGDVLGATQQLVETCILLVLIAQPTFAR